MPSDNPLVGETWETVDLSTGQAAQAVVIEVNPQMVRLQARLGRIMTMPLQSFHLMWKLILDAPLEACAYQDCRNLADFKEAPELAPEGDGPVKPGSTWWEKRTYRKVFVAKLVKGHVQTNQGNLIPFPKFLDAHTDKTPDPPCNVGEEWADNAGKAVFTVEQNLETSTLVRYSPGEPPREIPYYILATRYKKSTRRSALQRIVDDE